jgi:tetratricopeptide (TPR) repeat protein
MSNVAEEISAARKLGNRREAVLAWRRLLRQTHVDEADYGDWCRELANVYLQNKLPLSAARVYEYLQQTDAALRLYDSAGTPRDRGRVLMQGNQPEKASEQYKEAGLFGNAAHAAEQAGKSESALALFEQLSRSQEARGQRMLAGLATLNAGRLALGLGKSDRARSPFAHCTRILEEEADVLEQEGDRDDAFRCYLCILQVGTMDKSYEHIAEGALNCIRLLKAKSDRFFTMQYYYDLISRSEELGELHSAAELYREAGEYARRVGFIYGDFFLVEAGRAWKQVAKSGMDQGTPPELIENALLAAVGCFNRVKQDEQVAACYRALSELPLNEKKIRRYAQLGFWTRSLAGTSPTPLANWWAISAMSGRCNEGALCSLPWPTTTTSMAGAIPIGCPRI